MTVWEWQEYIESLNLEASPKLVDLDEEQARYVVEQVIRATGGHKPHEIREFLMLVSREIFRLTMGLDERIDREHSLDAIERGAVYGGPQWAKRPAQSKQPARVTPDVASAQKALEDLMK